jgi:hypothetical protein
MGTIVIYRCPNCSYQTQLVSGGYQATYRPMLCGTCKQLVNVLTELHPSLRKLADPALLAHLNRCPTCQSTRLTPWDDAAAPCPRCQHPMDFTSGPQWPDAFPRQSKS